MKPYQQTYGKEDEAMHTVHDSLYILVDKRK